MSVRESSRSFGGRPALGVGFRSSLSYAENVTITTDGIPLIGQGATLVLPAEPEPAPNPCSFGEPSTDGICAIGVLDFPDPERPPVVTDPVTDVTVSGFTVIGFEGTATGSTTPRPPPADSSSIGTGTRRRHRRLPHHPWCPAPCRGR